MSKEISRRGFLGFGAGAVLTVALEGCGKPEYVSSQTVNTFLNEKETSLSNLTPNEKVKRRKSYTAEGLVMTEYTKPGGSTITYTGDEKALSKAEFKDVHGEKYTLYTFQNLGSIWSIIVTHDLVSPKINTNADSQLYFTGNGGIHKDQFQNLRKDVNAFVSAFGK